MNERSDSGQQMFELVRRLYPICRSITGDGVRQTLAILGEETDLEITEVPSGKDVFDWTVPDEWVIRDAWIKDSAGNKVIDFAAHNLHVLNYSEGVNATVTRAELDAHLYSLPEQPDWIPYRTAYYQRKWGFCLSQNQRDALTDTHYQVCIDAQHIKGSLSYGEIVVPGKSDREILFYSHVCHPSLANDNLAGLAVCTFLARALSQQQRHFTYRFVFGPGTIGSITWLAENPDVLARTQMGLVAVLLGDNGPLTYKQSRDGDAVIDRIVPQALRDLGLPAHTEPFEPYGYEERQFNSPGIALPTGRLSRSANGRYPQYHTSADNLDLVSADALSGALDACLAIVDIIDQNHTYTNLAPHGEPQLGKRGLYGDSGGQKVGQWEMAMLWVLNLSDGQHDLLSIAERSGLSFTEIASAADNLRAAGLLQRTPQS